MSQDLRFYKPNKAGNGYATKWQMRHLKDKFNELALFVVGVQQDGLDAKKNAKFGWDDKTKAITMKLAPVDASALLAVLGGQKEFVGKDASSGLYHQSKVGNTVLNFKWDEVKKCYYLGMSSKRDDKLVKIQHALTVEEGIILKLVLEEFVRQYYRINATAKPKVKTPSCS